MTGCKVSSEQVMKSEMGKVAQNYIMKGLMHKDTSFFFLRRMETLLRTLSMGATDMYLL